MIVVVPPGVASTAPPLPTEIAAIVDGLDSCVMPSMGAGDKVEAARLAAVIGVNGSLENVSSELLAAEPFLAGVTIFLKGELVGCC